MLHSICDSCIAHNKYRNTNADIYTHTGSRSERISYSTYGDVDGQVPILPKALCHGRFKDEAVIVGNDAGDALVDAARRGLPRELPALANQLQLVPVARGWERDFGMRESKKKYILG